jgi:hypothetical protein
MYCDYNNNEIKEPSNKESIEMNGYTINYKTSIDILNCPINYCFICLLKHQY